MVKEEVDLFHERRIIAYSILSTEFLSGVFPHADKSLYATTFAKKIWLWIAEYFEQYNRAPEGDIQAIYISKEMEKDQDDNEYIATFLSNLSKDFPSIPANVEFLVDESVNYLRLRKLIKAQEVLQKAIDQKDIIKGEQVIADYRSTNDKMSSSISLFSNVAAAVDAFARQDEALFKLPGALGQVVGVFNRTDFIALQAPFKMGKSWWAMYIALVAAMQNRRVLFIPMEMPEWQVMRRMWMMIRNSPKSQRVCRIPKFYTADCSKEYDKKYNILVDEKELPGIDASAEKFQEWMTQYHEYYDKGDIVLRRMPKGASVKDLDSLLTNLEFYDKFVPDVVIVDQLDYFGSRKKGDDWIQKDDIWSSARDLALSRNICLISPTQTNAEGLKGAMGLNTTAGAKSKIGHITKCIDIYASHHDKKKGIYRISCNSDRDEENLYNVAIVLSCLSTGQVCLDSRLKTEVILDKEKDDD